MEDGFGSTRLSRERAKRLESWSHLEKAYEAKETIRGVIVGRVKGGFTVEINKVRAFLPGSLVDVKPIRDPEALKEKNSNSKLSKLIQNATISSFPVVLFLKLKAMLNVLLYSKILMKATK